MTVWVVVNLGLRFVLELCAFAALAYWGAHTGSSPLARIGLGVGAPLAAVTVWAVFVSPKALWSVGTGVRLAMELCVFAAAVSALAALGRGGLAVALTMVYAVNRVLLATMDH